MGEIYQPRACSRQPHNGLRGASTPSSQVSVSCDWEGLAGCPRQTWLQGGAPPQTASVLLRFLAGRVWGL